MELHGEHKHTGDAGTAMAKIILNFDSYQSTSQASYYYTFLGFQLEVTEGDDQNTHRVAVLTDGPEYDREQIRPLYRFVSALCWKYNMPVYVGRLTACGHNAGDASEPRRYDRITGYAVPTGLFEPHSTEQEIAMGLYREAKSSDSPFYSFLAFYQILELKPGKKSNRQDWINSNLASLTKSKRQLEEVRQAKAQLNVGKRIVELRNGVAHAVAERPIDIDGYPHLRELNILRFVIEELAERFMVDALGFT